MQARTRGGGGGGHWVHVHLIPEEEFRWETSKRRNFCRQERIHVPLRYNKIKTKKVGEKRRKVSKERDIERKKERG